MTRLSYQTEVYNTLSKWKVPFYFSKPVMNHMVHFIDGALSVGFTGKLTEIHAASYHKRHCTTISHFLKNSSWNEEYLLNTMKRHTMSQLEKEEVLFLSFDDTILEKTKPSSRAKHPTKSAAFHFSHTQGKSVWSHQVLQLLVGSEEKALPYEFELYHKEKTPSKIQLSIDIIQQFPTITKPTYLLCDTWFTSKKLIQAALAKGIHVIGGLKTNRMIYPKGIKVQAKEFSKYIQKGDTNLITVGSQSYRVYRYEGALNDIETAVVLMCWKNGSSIEPENM